MLNMVKRPKDLIEDYDLFLVDIWGVISEGADVYPGVIDSLKWLASKKPLCFVTNSPRLKIGVKERLESFGLNVAEEMIYSSGAVAAIMIDESEKYLGVKNPVIYELTDSYFENIYKSTNWNFNDDINSANIIIVTAQMKEGEDLNKYDHIMQKAAELGLVCICPNPDTIIPDGNSKTYCPGFIVRNYTGKLIYTGKPHGYIYEPIFDKYSNIPKERILMIGDTIEMDILGAQNAGINSALVPTGNANVLMKKLGLAESDFSQIRKHIEMQPSILLDLG